MRHQLIETGVIFAYYNNSVRSDNTNLIQAIIDSYMCKHHRIEDDDNTDVRSAVYSSENYLELSAFDVHHGFFGDHVTLTSIYEVKLVNT